MDARFPFVVYLGLLMGFHWLGSVALFPFSGINYARNKNATQEPNTFLNYTADLAVDGYTFPVVDREKSCSHTWGDPSLPSFWTVDLGLQLYVTGIIIYNRDDPKLWIRLKNFKIYGLTRFEKETIYDDDGKNLFYKQVIRIEIDATQTYSLIQIWIPARVTNDTILTLCEVEVYGVPLCRTPDATNGILRDDNNTRLDEYEEGQTLYLTCFEGFTSETGQRNLTCQKNHSWNALPICSKIPEGISSTYSDPHKTLIGGLSGGLTIAVVGAGAAVGAFLVYFLRWQRKKSQDAELYTRLRSQLASNIESEYAKIQETVVT